MRLLSIWLVILGLATTLALGLALLAPRPLSDALEHETGERLHVASQSAALLLRLSARQWIDTAQRDATDAVLLEAVSEANRGPADLGILHKTVQERLRAFATKAGAELALATDGKGRVLARVGVDEATYKDGVDGLPVVVAALRGDPFRRHVCVAEGHLYRLVAAPVVSGPKFIGVLVLGQEIGSQLAQSLHERLGVPVAVLLRGRIGGSARGWPAAIAEELGVTAATRQQAQLTAGPTAPLPIGGQLAVLAPVAGQVSDALLAVAGARPPAAQLAVAGARRGPGSDPRAWPIPSLITVGAGLLAVLLINGLLLAFSFGRPMRQLTAAVQAAARGDATRIIERVDAWAPLSRAINGALERAEVARAGESPRASNPLSLPPPAPPLPSVTRAPASRGSAPRLPALDGPRATAGVDAPLFDDPMTVRGKKPVLPKRGPVIADDADDRASIPRLEQTGEHFATGTPELLSEGPETVSGGLPLEPLVPTPRTPLLGEDDESTTI